MKRCSSKRLSARHKIRSIRQEIVKIKELEKVKEVERNTDKELVITDCPNFVTEEVSGSRYTVYAADSGEVRLSSEEPHGLLKILVFGPTTLLLEVSCKR